MLRALLRRLGPRAKRSAAPSSPSRALPSPRAASDPGRQGRAWGGVEPPAGHGHAQDYAGRVAVEYAPDDDGRPDPGEVVWTWVPYEEDHDVGKDRPVVVVGRALDGPAGSLAVLMLSSRPHEDDPRWLLLGPGGWDPEGRGSSVRLDRLLAVFPEDVRREGAALDRARFDSVAAALKVTGRT